MDIKDNKPVYFKSFLRKKSWEEDEVCQLDNYINQCLINSKKIVYVRLKYNIWTADLTEMRLLSSFNQNVNYLLCVIDIFNKYAWFKP